MSGADHGALEARLGHRFARPELLERALCHTSRAHELGDAALGNERLEFLGDAVLDLVVSERLMAAHPELPEGRLSRARAEVVSGRALAPRALELGLDAHVALGRGERRSGGERKPSILANVLEAVVGALYLDGGLAPVRTLVERHFSASLEEAVQRPGDAKTRLQERLHARGAASPDYRVIAESGPDHAPEFTVEVCDEHGPLAEGRGGSKRDAEQDAARRALLELEAPTQESAGS